MTAAEFRDAVDALELTQRGAARLLGVNERTMRHWMQGDRPIPEPVRRLLALLDMPEVRARLA